MYDARLTRWITQSIHKHFETATLSCQLILEHQGKDFSKYQAWAEVRMDGPHVRQRGRINYDFVIFVNVLVTDKTTTDLYSIERLTGELSVILGSTIVVRQYGIDSDEGTTIVGCLNREGEVQINNQGTSSAKQSSVETTYVLKYKE